MTSSLLNQQKRDFAKLLYVKDNLSQQEIAAKVGTTTRYHQQVENRGQLG